MKDYPEVLMVTFLCCCFVVVQSAIVALMAERDPIAWRLKADMELVAIACSVSIAKCLISTMLFRNLT